MQCLHQLRNGRYIISCSVLSCSLSCRGSLFRGIFFSPNSSSSTRFFCSSDFPCPTSPTSSILVVHTSFLVSFSVLVSQHHEFLPHLVHVGRLEIGVHSFVFGSSNLTFSFVIEPAFASNCTTNTLFLLLIGILWPAFEHDDVFLVDSRIHGGLLTSASKNFMLHFLPSRTNSSFASLSTRIGRPSAAANLTVFISYRPSFGSARRSWELPNQQVISTISIVAPRQLHTFRRTFPVTFRSPCQGASFPSKTDSFLWGHGPDTLACKARPSFDRCGTSLSVSLSLSLSFRFAEETGRRWRTGSTARQRRRSAGRVVEDVCSKTTASIVRQGRQSEGKGGWLGGSYLS